MSFHGSRKGSFLKKIGKRKNENWRQKRREQCAEKIKYITQTEAVASIRNFRLKGKVDEAKEVLASYRCEICGYWHIGHRPPNKKTRKRRYKK